MDSAHQAAANTRQGESGKAAREIARLKAQLADLTLQLETHARGEREAQAAVRGALSSANEAAREQARLHEELAAREKIAGAAFISEAQLQVEVAAQAAKIRQLEKTLAETSRAATARADDLDRALTQSRQSLVETRDRLVTVSSEVRRRAGLQAVLAAEMRNQRRRTARVGMAVDAASDEQPAIVRAMLAAAFAARLEAKTTAARVRDERWQRWRDHAIRPTDVPTRRNRLAKMIDRFLSKGRSPGVAALIARSGLWKREFSPDAASKPSQSALLKYARAGAHPQARPVGLFDHGHYLGANADVARQRLSPLAHYLLRGDLEGRSPHPLFSTSFYRSSNAQALGATGLTAFQHFLFFGAAEGRDPHPLFDVKYYVGQLHDSEDTGGNPLVHYLRTGWRRGFNPHPLFDNDWYLQRYPDVGRAMIPPLLHYVTAGAREGRDPHPLFFGRWYEDAYPDVAALSENPLAHFVMRGLIERRHPNPFFDTDHYLNQAPEALSRGMNPLQHYLEAGAWKGLSPNREFDPVAFLGAASVKGPVNLFVTPLEAWISAGATDIEAPQGLEAARLGPMGPEIDALAATYRPLLGKLFDAGLYRAEAGDLMGADDDALDHYLFIGWRAGLNPHTLFANDYYLDLHPEAVAARLPPLLHFVTTGASAGLSCHPLFDTRWYIDARPDVVAAGMNPLEHFIEHGGREGMSPSPLFNSIAYLQAYPDVADAGVNPLIHFLTQWPSDTRRLWAPMPAMDTPEGVDPAVWIEGLAKELGRIADRAINRSA